MGELILLFKLAVRNLFASFLNLIIGGIILIGTLLFVVGGSLLNSVDSAMSKSITGSIAGDIQVFSDYSKEDLSLYSDWTAPDISPIPDYSKIVKPILSVPNVKTIIPMGVDGASVTYGNTIDQILEKLRKAIGQSKTNPSPELTEKIESLKSHVRHMVKVIEVDYQKYFAMSSKQVVEQENIDALKNASSDEFWNSFDKDPFTKLEFLENHIALLVPDADMIFLGYVGTDLQLYQSSFDRMEIVDGKPIPPGQRGILISKYVYEEQFKVKSARRLDKIKEAIVEKGKRIAKDPDLQLMIKQNRTQTREIILQLDPVNSKKAVTALQAKLGTQETELSKLFSDFFDTTDANFSDRYDFFYKEIAPLIELYRLRPNDTITIKAFTKSGFLQSANLKIYGTFQFKGLEKSGLAGGKSLMDLMSFRDLYGYMTPDKLDEAATLKRQAGTKFVSRDSVESELFGGSTTVTKAKEARIDEKKEIGETKWGATREAILNRVYSKDEIEKGVVLNAAVILKDPTKLHQTIKEIEEVSKREGLNLRVFSWQKAAGNLGQFVLVAKIALYFSVFVIFIVALVVINNAVMMATLQRIREIGTMRAIGAQRGFVLSLVLVETLLLGVTFGLAGTFLGALAVKWLGIKGIAAPNEFLYFFFAGPRLYATLNWGSLVGAFIIICGVTCISSLYPAIIATRVSPLQAMQAEE